MPFHNHVDYLLLVALSSLSSTLISAIEPIFYLDMFTTIQPSFPNSALLKSPILLNPKPQYYLALHKLLHDVGRKELLLPEPPQVNFHKQLSMNS